MGLVGVAGREKRDFFSSMEVCFHTGSARETVQADRGFCVRLATRILLAEGPWKCGALTSAHIPKNCAVSCV
jgi:hypothetical protein